MVIFMISSQNLQGCNQHFPGSQTSVVQCCRS